MVARSEVALIVANKGAALGLLSTLFFAPVILMVVVTAIVTPVLLKLVYRDTEAAESAKPQKIRDIVGKFNRNLHLGKNAPSAEHRHLGA
jgi:hypothetical protein